jgi:hypothetical protein
MSENSTAFIEPKNRMIAGFYHDYFSAAVNI